MKYSKKRRKKRLFLVYAILICFIIYLLSQAEVNINAKAFLITCALFPMLFRLFIKAIKKIKYLTSSLRKIDTMEGEEFEELLQAHFEKKGYRVSLTPLTGDYGADLILKKGGEKIIVQAKRYRQKVGNSAIQEIVAAKGYYEADKCMVITNSYFTQNAIDLAAANNVELWDRDDLRKNFSIA